MVNSVDTYTAGEEYDLDEQTADRFVLLGYAEGDLSRNYSDVERELIRAHVQVVNV